MTQSVPSDAKLKLRPRLRFPEFRDGPGWGTHSLEKISEFVGERVLVSELDRKDYVSTENLLPDFGGLLPAVSFPSGGSVVRYRTNDILAANIRPYLKKIWLANRDGGASNDVIVIRALGSIGHLYLSHVLKNDRFITYVMSGAKGLKMPRGDLALIREYPVPTPSPAEQQKIAKCLSTLDELIEAESQKLNALKVHKKGLMQQIFPCEGETLPRLRFPKFQKKPGWKPKKAGELFNHRIEPGEVGLPIYSVTMNDGMVERSSLDRRVDNIEDSESNKKVFKDDLAYNMMRMWQGAFGVAPEDCMVSPAYVVLALEQA